MADNKSNRIIILGAGLSGLALAQALKQHDPPIPFTVFERDAPQHPSTDLPPKCPSIHDGQRDHSLRSQGYRIRISPAGASALKRLLPSHLFEAFEATAAKVEEGKARLDAWTAERSELFAGTGGKPPVRPTLGGDEPFEDLVGGRSFNVDRAVVRSLLLDGLEEGTAIVFGRKAESYSILPNSEGVGVKVRFEDGSVERGSFLVGADGVRSSVRRQMLQDFRLLDTEGRAVFGKTPISEDLKANIPPSIFGGISVCKDAREARIFLFCDIMRFDHAAAAAATHDAIVESRVPEDYIYWVLGFRQDILANPERARGLLRLSHEQSADLSLELTASWHKNIRNVLENQVREASSTLAILTSALDFEQVWATRASDTADCVTVMGDAAHPMPPVGGVGANTAWQDAHDLFSALVTSCQRPDDSDRVAAVQAYEAKMLARARPAVERSAGGAVHLMGLRPMGELKEVDWSR